MRTIERRLKRLEGRKQPAGVDLPTVIFICPGNGEPVGAMKPGGGALEREPGESAEAFERRALLDMNQTRVILPRKQP